VRGGARARGGGWARARARLPPHAPPSRAPRPALNLTLTDTLPAPAFSLAADQELWAIDAAAGTATFAAAQLGAGDAVTVELRFTPRALGELKRNRAAVAYAYELADEGGGAPDVVDVAAAAARDLRRVDIVPRARAAREPDRAGAVAAAALAAAALLVPYRAAAVARAAAAGGVEDAARREADVGAAAAAVALVAAVALAAAGAGW